MNRFHLGIFAALALLTGMSLETAAGTNTNHYSSVPSFDNGSASNYPDQENQGWYQPDIQVGYQPAYYSGSGGQRQVCLVTFFRRDQVRGGADVNVQRARLLPLRVAQRLVRFGDRSRIFYYGSNQKTRDTCFYLARLQNHDQSNNQELACLVTFFRRDQVNGGADADVERARLMPRQVAESLVGQSNRSRIFVYGSNQKTRETCRYLANLDNQNQSDNQNQNDNQDPSTTQERVCLVTFFTAEQVSGGADADVERARLLPRRVAESLDGPDDRNRIFVYGSNQKTEETCRYLNGINN